MSNQAPEIAQSSPLRMAKVIHVMLLVIMGLLGLMFATLIIFGAYIMFQTDSSAQQSLAQGLQDVKLSLPSNIVPFAVAIVVLGYFFVARCLRGIVKTTLQGNPFVESNISRLRFTWIILVLVELFRLYITAPGSAFPETHLSVWFLIFVIAVMAEVFRIGLELKRDQELTV